MALGFKKYLGDKDRRRGLIGTFFVHVMILFALFFLALRTPLPLPGEEGVEVNLGYDEQGYGEIQSESAPPESQPTPPPPQQEEQVEPEPEIVEPEPEVVETEPELADEEIVTQDIEEAPVIEEKIEEEKKEEPIEEVVEEKEPEPVKEEPKEEPVEETVDSTFVSDSEEMTEEVVEDPKPEVNTRALYPGTSKNKEGTNEGNTQGAGDMGKPQGYKDSEGYDGKGGKGDGISYGLGGRGNLHLDVPPSNFEEVGEIKVTIFVNREGVVVDARIDYSGTTVLSPQQREQAIDAALNSKFEQKSDAPEKDRGWITYSYIK